MSFTRSLFITGILLLSVGFLGAGTPAYAAECTTAQLSQGLSTWVVPGSAGLKSICAKSLAEATPLYSTSQASTPASTASAPSCTSGAAVPSGWSCPPQWNPNSPDHISEGQLINGTIQRWTKCPYAAGSANAASECTNGWRAMDCTESGFCTYHGSTFSLNNVKAFAQDPVGTATSAVAGWAGDATMYGVWWVLALTAHMYFFAAQFLLWMAMTLLDMVTYFLVINMGAFIQNTVSTGIHQAWQILRDLGNVAIIAGFIAVGISTILQVEAYNANRFLARLIIAALLINFSYFIAGSIIDASNFIAREIYTGPILTNNGVACKKMTPPEKMTPPATLKATGVLNVVSAETLCSISSSFTADLGLETWDGVRQLSGDSSAWNLFGTSDQNKKLFFVGILAGFFTVVTGYVFFSAAILLLGRFVVLIILLVTSPIGVAGSNIPFLDQYAKQWWSALVGQAMFAPVYFLLVAISLKILRDLKQLLIGANSGDVGFSNLVSGHYQDAVNAVPLVINFMLGIGFMYVALNIARTMSKSGEQYFGEIYAGLDKSLGGIYGNFYQATAARALRIPSTAYDATLGQVAKYRIPLPGGAALQHALSSLGQSLRGDPNAKPFGATKTREELNKASADYIKSLPSTVSTVYSALRHPGLTAEAIRKGGSGMWEGLLEWWKSKPIEDLLDQHAKHLADPKNNPALTAAERKRVEHSVQHMSDEDFGKLSAAQLELRAPFMNAKQLKGAVNRGDLTHSQVEAIEKARWNTLDHAREKAKETGDWSEVTKLMGDMDKDERALLFTQREDLKADKEFLGALKGKNFDELIANRDVFSESEAEAARDVRTAHMNDVLVNGTEEQIQAALKRSSDEDVKRFSSDASTNLKVLNNMSISQLRLRFKEANETQRKQIIEVLGRGDSKWKPEDATSDMPNAHRYSEPTPAAAAAQNPPAASPPAAGAPIETPPTPRVDDNPPPNPADSRDGGYPEGIFRGPTK